MQTVQMRAFWRQERIDVRLIAFVVAVWWCWKARSKVEFSVKLKSTYVHSAHNMTMAGQSTVNAVINNAFGFVAVTF